MTLRRVIPLLLLALLLGGVLLVNKALFGDAGDKQGEGSHSSYEARPEGMKAFYLLLSRLGLAPKRWKRSFRDLSPEIRTLIVNAPTASPSPDEVVEVLEWVKEGGTLFWGIDERDPLARRLKIRQFRRNYGQFLLSRFPPKPLFQGVRRVKVEGEWHLAAVPDAEILLDDDRGAFLLALPYFRGRIFLAASPLLLSNRTLSMDDNAVFAVRLVEEMTGGASQENRSIWFDEFHNGYAADRSLWTAIPLWLQVTVAQLAIALLVGFLHVGARFGSPFPLPELPRRSILEYIASTANLYRRAEARSSAFRLLYLGFRRRICQYLGVSLETPAHQLVALLTNRKKFPEKEFEAVLLKCEDRLLGGGLSEHELFLLARELEKWKKELILR